MTPDKNELRKGANEWCLYMFICALVSFFTAFSQKYAFGVVGENISLNMRKFLYSALVKKSIGWFDIKENAPGVLTSVLASEAQQLNGASTEGVAVMIESFFAVGCGIVIGFFMSWRLSLVALGCVPFMILGGAINSKMT